MFLECGLGRGKLCEVVALIIIAARPAPRGSLRAERRVLVGKPSSILARLIVGARLAFGGRTVGRRGRSFLAVREISALEQRVFGQIALELLIELDRGQLQQSDGLLELRREREMLR